MRRCVWLVPVLIWCSAPPAWAVDPNRRISQYAHASWRMQDGFFSGSPHAIVQTQDGYLWLGTEAGLLRFDGVRFVPWSPEHGERLPTSRINELLPARDGSLWISTDGGLSRWKNQTLTNYRTGRGGTRTSFGGPIAILEDRNGRIWFTQLTEGSPLCRVEELETRCFGSADGVPPVYAAWPLIEDPQGALWFGGSKTLVRWNHTSHIAYQPSGLKNNFADGFTSLAAASDGTVWAAIGRRGPGLGLQQLVQGRWQSFKTPELDGDALNVRALRLDREGSLWVGTADRGLYRLRGRNVDHFDRTNGLSSDYVQAITEDREGNLWVTTSQGVDRFSDTAIVSFADREGLCSTEVDSVLASRDGSIWVGGDGALSRIQGGRVSCLRPANGLPGTQVTSLLEDHAGRLWVGVDHTLSIYEDGVFHRITRPDGSQVGFVSGMAEDSEHRIWVAVYSTRLLLQIDARTLAVREAVRDQRPRRVAVDPAGGVWLGLINGDLAHYSEGQLTTIRFAQDDATVLQQILADSDGSTLAATTSGLIGWHNGKQLTLTTKNGLPCGSVNQMTFDAHDNLWLFMDCALGTLTRADLQQWKTNPDAQVPIRTLDVLDGFRSGLASFAGGARSPDGRLWFAGLGTLQMIDPTRLRRNAVPPPVHVEQIVADRTIYPAAGVVRLPPLTRDLEIDYVGLSFVAPQRVRFRYRLEGRDTIWQEPGTRRQAFYSDLRPGSYRFRVIASNNDGVWNEEGASLEIVVAPAWYQTRAFLVLSMLSGVLAMWAAYHVRMQQVARALNARFDARLEERTRMARDLHDTLLQTVQGSKIVADTALDRPDDAPALARALQQVSVWLGHAGEQGRAAINALRSSRAESDDLAAAFQRAVEDCRREGVIDASLTVIGDVREIHPFVRDELFRIGYEAIRNARTHSRGSRLDITLTYSDDLTLRVADNGVGMESTVAEHGKDGHFGVRGMRERSARIGATLLVTSASGAGTAIAITVPGRVIFRRGGTDRSRRPGSAGVG